MIKARLIIGVIFLGMLTFLFGACASPAPPLTPTPEPSPVPTPELSPTPSPTPESVLGIVEVYVTDAPPDEEVTAVLLTISRLEIHRAVAEQEQEEEQSGDNQTPEQESEQDQEGQGEWITINISDDMAPFDLLEVEGIEEFFGAAEVEAGKYTQLRLIVDKAEVALGENEPQEATVPSKEVKIVRPFDVEPGETTTILLDFDAEHSVNITGAGEIQVKPVVKLSITQKGQSGEPEEGDKEDKQDKGEEEPVAGVSLEVSCEEFQGENHITREAGVAVGDLLVVTLCSNPTTGFQWSENAEIGDAAVLEQLSHEFIAPKGSDKKDPPPGASGKEVWTFRALTGGTTSVSMEYSQPWQDGEKGAWTFALTVTVD